MTVSGLRPVRTVRPPSAACTTMPRKSSSAGLRRSRRPARQAVTRAAATAAESTKVSIRLPNSITPWAPISRVTTRLWSVQRGNVGQPSPEAVSRTAPPVTTITVFMTRAPRNVRRSTVSVGRHAITRASMPPAYGPLTA